MGRFFFGKPTFVDTSAHYLHLVPCGAAISDNDWQKSGSIVDYKKSFLLTLVSVEGFSIFQRMQSDVQLPAFDEIG